MFKAIHIIILDSLSTIQVLYLLLLVHPPLLSNQLF